MADLDDLRLDSPLTGTLALLAIAEPRERITTIQIFALRHNNASIQENSNKTNN